MGQASITMDIRAQVTGYEQSLAKLQQALGKLDPGSDIAKKISAAFSTAEKQVQSLGKNMLPKATNDTQIDALVGKVNAAGESIREVMNLFSHINIGDLDLSKIGDEFTTLTTKIGSLQSELDTKLNAGLLEAVKNSTELSQVFSQLGTDLSKADATTLFTDMETAASKAQSAVAEAEKKVTDLELALNAAKTRESDLLKSPLGTLEGKLNLDDTVKNIESQYDNAFSALREKIKTGLLSLGVNDTIAQNKLLDDFFNGLTPDNVRTKIEELFNTLKSSDLVSKKTEMYQALFGVDGNINAVIKNLNLNGLLEPLKEQLHNLIESIKLQIGGKNAAKIEELIAKNDLENAAKTTLSVITKVYGNVQDAIVKEQQTTARLTTEMGTARAAVDSAKTNQTFIDNANIQLKNDYEALAQKNADLQNQINELKQQVANLLAKNVVSTQAAAKAGGNIANQLHLSTDAARAYKEELAQVTAKEQMVGKIQGVVQRWFSIYAAIRMVGNAVRAVISTIQELDRTITEIAIVTDMGQGDLWKQMPQYTALAREYAASISGVYQVSQLYYQQGLETADVMALTEQTLKMARISGLDYAQATDYMTNAVRSFKMEMTEAQTIVDVYSSIAASSATSVTELASAMSKTASSAEAVGSSFQNTTAMMAVMIEATRESAENIGSAMKSIISRYGEMTSDPSKLVDSEGQEMSLNRVDKALQTVGITIHDTMGEFRDFDDVIMELAEKWDTIDKNTQRYIATIMAGNRQQSRFLALVSSYDRLKELSETAANSEDASQLQFLKTLDSVDAKVQQFQTSVQDLYVNSGLENVYKGALDWANSLITTLDQLSTKNGLIVTIGKIGATFTTLATLVTNIFSMVKGRYTVMKTSMQVESKVAAANEIQIETEKYAKVSQIYDAETQTYVNATEERVKAAQTAANEGVMAAQREAKAWEEEQARMQKANTRTKGGMIASAFGLGATMIAGSIDVNENRGLKSVMTGIGSALSGVGTGFMIDGTAGGIIGVLTALPGIIEAIGMASESSEERLKRLQDTATESNNKRIQTNAAYTDLKSEMDQVKELAKTYEDSAEAKAEYYEHSNAIAEQYPTLVSAYDGEGNAILSLANSYEILKKARGDASDAAITSASDSIEAAEEAQKQAEQNYRTAGGNTLYTNLGNQDNWNINFESNGSGDFINIPDELAWLSQKAYQHIGYGEAYNISLLASDLKTEQLPGNNLNKIFDAIFQNEFDDLYALLDSEEELQATQEEIDNLDLENPGIKNAVQFLFDRLTASIESIGLLSEQGAMEAAQATTKAVNRSSIALLTQQKFADAILESQYNNGISADYVSEFSAVGSIINDKIYDLWTEAKEKNSALKFEDFAVQADVTQAYTDIMSEISKFWEDLSPDKQTELNTLIANRGKYTSTEFANKFKELTGRIIDTEDGLEEWQDELLKYYDESFDITKFNNALHARQNAGDYSEALDSILEKENELLEQLGPDELSNILKLYDSLVDRIQNGSLSTEDATDIYNQYISAFAQSNDKIQEILFNTDLFSFSSLTSAIETLSGEEYAEDAGPAIDALKAIMHLIPINLNTEVQTIISQFTKGLSDFENSIKNATKGVNFKTMSEEVQKLGLEFSDFDFKEGQYYVKDYINLSNKLTENLMAPINNLLNELNSREIEANNKFDYVDTTVDDMLTEGTKEDFASFLKVDIDELNNLYENYLLDVLKVDGTREIDFFTWYYDNKKSELTKTAGEAKRYANDLLARSALESGMVETFAELALSVDDAGKQLWDALSPDDKTTLINAIISGDISSLTEEQSKYFEQYSTLIASTYKSIQSSIADSMISAVGGGNNKITITKTNIEAIKKLGASHSNWFEEGTNFDNLEVGDTVSLSAEQLAKDSQNFIQWLTTEIKDESERLKKYQEYYKNSYSNKAIASFTKIADKDSFSLEDFQQYLQTVHNASNDYVIENWQAAAKSMGLSVNAMGQLIITDYDKWAEELEWATSIIESDGASIEEINNARTILANAKTAKDQTERAAIEDIVKNYTTVTSAQKESLANALRIDVKDLEPYFKLNNDGITSTFDLNAFQQAIKDKTISIGDSAFNLFFSIVKNMADGILDSINKASSYISEGTTNFTEMQAFTDEYNNLFNQDLSTAFNYNEILQAWTLNPIVYQNYLRKQIDDLVASGNMTVHQALDYTRKELSSKIDIASYVGSGRNGFSTESIKQTMIAFNTTFSLYTKELEQAEKDYQKQLDETVVQGKDKKIDTSPIEQAKKKVQDIQGQIATNATLKAESDLKLLLEGGEEAVKIYKEYTDDSEETFENIQAVYLNKLNRYQNTISNLEGLQVGSTVDEQTAETLNELKDFGFEVDSKGVVKAVGKMEDAYQQLYIKMKETTLATTSQLNTVYAQYLTAEEQPEIDAISALGDAMGMTYDALGSLLANYGTNLKYVADHWEKYGISQIGNGKIRINDFQAFAQQIGLTDTNSEEYISAFKTYNDSLIDLNRKTEKTIYEEIKSITEAQGGDWLNLTQFSKLYEKMFEALVPDNYIGNVDLKNRPILDFGDYYETLYSSTFLSEDNNLGVLLTSITEDGKQIVYENLEEYANRIMEEAKAQQANGDSRDISEIVKEIDASRDNLLLDVVASTTEDIASILDSHAEDLHLRQSNWYGIINALEKYGATFEDGILKLSENADIAGIVDAITSQEFVADSLIPSELAELRDAISSFLTNITNSIKNGISGTLSNADANSLREFAKRLNIDIDFTETAEGLKLSTASAMKLYLQLKQIDKLQAQSLLPDIASMSDNYNDLTSACKRYNELIKINTKSLLEEKTVLEDLIKSMMTDPNSYKFMSATELPAGWQMVENALTDLDEAKTKITAAQKSSFMGASDFVNIINAAAAYNPDFSINGMNAEQLIAAAGNSLIRKNGEFGVNLSKSGLNLDTNALSSIYKQLESGLQLFGNQATAYYDMSDQFAKISDAIHRIDPINFEEIFGKPDSQAFNSDAFKNYFDNLNKAAPELADSLSNLLINGKSLGEIIKSGDWNVWKTAGFTEETFSKFIEGIDNIDWTDASQAAAHVSDLISQSGIGSIDLKVDPNSFIHITTSGEALKIDLNNSQLRNKVIQEYNKYIKGSSGTKATAQNITDKLQELAQEYETTVKVEEKVNIRRILAIAEGRFDPKNFKKNKDGSWSYTYNGNTFTAKTPDGQPKQSDEKLKKDLSDQITQAIMLEDDGFDVTVEGGTITGHQLIDNMVVDVSIDDSGHYEYIVNGKKFKAQTYKELLTELAQEGMASEKQAGTKVELENGEEGTVKIDSYTGLVYTYYIDDEGQYHYIFEGHTFDDYGSFRTYMNLRSKFSDGEISDSPDKSTRTIKVAEGLKIVYDFKTNSVQYLVNDVNVQNPDNFEAWQAAMGEDDFKFEKVGEGEGLKATFTANGIPIEIIQNTDGTLTYTYTDDQGNQFTAHDLEGYENMLRGIAAVNGGDLGTIEGGSYTITANNVTVTVNTDGTVTNSEGKVLTADDLKELGLGNLASIPATIDTNVNITADDQASSVIKKVEEALISLASKTYTATVTAKVDTNAGAKGNAGSPRSTKSKTFFNTALVGGTPTLMGELGPELVVSNGRYFIVGESGAEMVPLEKDAVVFNHIQTRQLLTNGKTGRGVPKTNDRTAVGMVTGNVHGGPARLGYHPNSGSGSGTPSTQQAAITLSDDAKSKLSSLISDALSKGFENLDWSDYEKELGSMMDEIKNTARINYRTFIDTYASQCDKTTSEINELYFQAWQKDLEDSMDSEDIISAAEGLNFYANGNIGGSASDWQSIIGDRALITDLVKKGIMSYDAATKQYFVTNAEALANAGVDISQIEGIQEMMYDSLRSQYDQIVDYISNGLEGSLTAMDSKSLQSLVERMGITDLQLDFEQTVNGLKLSQESAISLYNELKKVDSIAAQLTFNELVENLQDSNDNYKTMTSLLSHIEDLSLKIQDANSYSDERIKQYTEELALAKEIAAVRATSADESMSWYDESIPAGMQNVLDYRQSWADAIDMMRDAQETGVFDFTGFINTAKQINSQAQTLGQTLNFCGYELNGTSEAIDAFITAAANSLGAVTNDNGTNFGVVLEKFGADLTDGAASYENSATSAMQTFAKSQIQILDGLIQMFEMIVAMESFKGVDEDDNGLLDWKELFNLDELEENSTEFAQYIKTEFKTAAQQILDNAGSNEDLQKALTSVKVNGNTMQELLEYATGAIDKLTYSMTAGDYQKAMSVFYNLLASGDYDLDNIASSLKEALATSGSDFKGTIEYGNFVLDMKYGVTISKTSTGTYKSKSGQEYPTAAEACKATVLEEAGLENDKIVWSEDKEVASGTVTYKSFSVEIIADAEGAHYNYNGVAYNSLEDATMAAWNAAGGEQGTQLTFDEWKIQQGITVVTTVSKVDTSNISKSQIDKLVGTSWQEIKAKWDAATGDKEAEEEFKIEYGFTLDGASEDDFNAMKERLGITENRMELTLAITNLDEIAAEFASKMTNITLNPTSADATGSATVTADTTEAVTSIGAVEEAVNKVIKAIEYLNTLKVAIDKGTAEADMQAIKDATKKAEEAVGNLNGAVSGLTTQFGNLNGTLSTLQTYLSNLSNSTISIHAVGQEVLGTIAQDLHSISTDIASLKEKEVDGKIVLNITTGGGEGSGAPKATGDVVGNGAFAAGSRQVLMGELGPELYVTGGRYYVAGQGGAEFVNLPNDAIVFNHLQTRKLLSTGAAGRGKPVTNEKAATSLATGNIMGLAMANAQQTLATLKQLRAMWQSLANASITDMVGLANMKDTESSSDGGSSKIDRKAWIETLEKWYNWLQKIAELEKEINYEEQLRNTLETRQGPKGKELYESQKRELEMIKQQYAVQKSLVDSRREYFETRRAQLNSSVFGKFYQFDEHGQQFYTRGTKFEFGKTAEYAAAQKAAQANGGGGATTTTTTNAAPEMTKHTAEWNKSIENLALAIYNNRAQTQWSRLSDGSISSKIHHYETMDQALKWAQTLYRIDENGKATYLGNPTAKGDPLAYSDVEGRLWDIWVNNIGVDFDRLQSGEKQRSNMDQNALNASSEYKKLLSQTIQDTAKAVGQEVGGGSAGSGAAGTNPPRSELAQITQIEGGFAALMELWARDPQTLEPKYTPAEQYAIAQSLGFGNYMLYDQSGNKIEPGENGQDDTFYTSALQALTDNLDADREEMQSLYDSIEEDEKKLLELEQKQNEILLAIRDNQIDVENKILDAIEAREQAIIDELSDTKEVLEDNADKYINGLNEALSNEQRMYQSNKSQTELESLRRQLAILQRSGGSASQINSLQQQIDAKEQENYFDAQQQQIDAIQAASDLEIERLDKQIEIMETTLEYSKEHGLLWAEVSQIMQQDDGVIMDFLLSNTAEYLATSALQQSATYDELLSMVNQWTAYRDDQNKYRPLQEDMEVGLEDIMANIFSTDANVEDSNVISAIVGANVQVAQGMQAVAAATGATALSGTGSNSTAGTGTTSSSGSIKGSGSTATSAYANWLNGMGNALGTTANWMTAIQSYYKGDSSKSMAAQTGALAQEHYDKAAGQPGSTAAKTWVASNDYVYDQSTEQLKRYAKWNLDNIAQDLQDINDPKGKYKDMPDDWKQNKIKVYQDVLRQNGRSYSSGGSVDYTGLAMVHGTPTRPEYFLDAEETQMWKHDILGGNSSSLTSRLLAFREILNGIESASSHINNSTDNGVIIEKAEVNVDVAQLANDYDARRAGDTIMDEILQIARKTGVSSVRR